MVNRPPEKPLRDWIIVIATTLSGIAAVVALIYANATVNAAKTQIEDAEAQTKIAQQSQTIDQFNNAIFNLESSTLSGRLNGIYELQIIMRHSRAEQPEIIQVISNFIRNSDSSPSKDLQRNGPKIGIRPSEDVQAALSLVANRNTSYDGGVKIDLQGANLDGAQLSNAKLAHADLRNARLYGANLTGAQLNYSNLTHADLRQSNLDRASLVFADLTGGDLSGASLHATNLAKATMIRTDLRGAQLNGYQLTAMSDPYQFAASLAGAYMPFANFENADVSWVNFSYTFLSGARFVHTTISYANFRNAYLGARWVYEQYVVDCGIPPADLTGINIDEADFYRANLDDVALTHSDLRYMGRAHARRRHVVIHSFPCSNRDLRLVNPNG